MRGLKSIIYKNEEKYKMITSISYSQTPNYKYPCATKKTNKTQNSAAPMFEGLFLKRLAGVGCAIVATVSAILGYAFSQDSNPERSTTLPILSCLAVSGGAAVLAYKFLTSKKYWWISKWF